MKTNKNISAIATMKKKQLIDKEGASLIRALIIISIIGLLAMFTNKASAQVRFNVQGDLVSSYVWRGMYQTGASIQPTLSFSVENLSLTAWGSTDFDGYRNGNIPSANKELDLTLAYTFPKLGLTVSVADMWWAGQGAGKYFDFNNKTTAHHFEASLAYVLPVEKFPPVVMPGRIIGNLRADVAAEIGLSAIPVVAVAGHDTASAVAAVPASGRNFAYLSSGTWSLMGIESEKPIVTDEAYRMNFTNEGGIDGTTRFLKNITGLWLLEQCLKVWKNKSGVTYSYPQIVEMAQSVATNESYVDPDDATFSNPVSMPEAIADYCKSHHMAVPRTHAEYVRCIFESLALKYRFVLTRLQTVASFPIECLHIIGGGSQNDLLNRFTANAIGLPVIAGPSEATALGNVLVQLRALGVVADRDSMRRLAAGAVSLQRYEPCDTELWNEKYVIFKKKCNLL